MAGKRSWKKIEFEVQQQKNYLKENSGIFFSGSEWLPYGSMTMRNSADKSVLNLYWYCNVAYSIKHYFTLPWLLFSFEFFP